MTIRPPLALTAAILLAPMAAQATEYRVMGEDERAISLLESTVKTDSDAHKESVFYIAFAEPVGGPTGPQVVTATILFDCEASRYKIGGTSSLTATMAPVQRADARYGWRDLAPNSPFSRGAAYACKREALPKADAAEMKAIIANYLARRAAAAATPAAPATTP